MTDLPKIPLAGVIGHPIAHSRSPALHGFWLRRYGIKGHYIPMDVAPADLEATLHHLPKIGFVGLNVTIPHKEAVLKIADVITDRAALIGAANTLIFRKDGKIQADNTDGAGFMSNLRQNAPGWNPSAGPAAVFGAGGAARAVVAALIEVGVPEIRISNRSRPRAQALRDDLVPNLWFMTGCRPPTCLKAPWPSSTPPHLVWPASRNSASPSMRSTRDPSSMILSIPR